MTGCFGELEKHFNHPAHKWLGLRQPVRSLQQTREVVEAGSDLRMLRAQTFFPNRQRAPLRGLRREAAEALLEQNLKRVWKARGLL